MTFWAITFKSTSLTLIFTLSYAVYNSEDGYAVHKLSSLQQKVYAI